MSLDFFWRMTRSKFYISLVTATKFEMSKNIYSKYVENTKLKCRNKFKVLILNKNKNVNLKVFMISFIKCEIKRIYNDFCLDYSLIVLSVLRKLVSV